MTYTEAIHFLYELRWFGAKLGLENTFRLAALAGNPHERLRFIHVAGTNGKGSTCAMLESMYCAAGLRVGLFTSPHLVAFGERIQVNRKLISDAEIVRLVEEMQAWLKEFPIDSHPTFFEVVTVMALRYFAEQQVELVIWETGLGGRLDATNIVTPLASVITNIQFDHQKWLGNTLSEIAVEKAGIIKPRIPVITAEENPEAMAVISNAARRNQSDLVRVPHSFANRLPLGDIDLPLLGLHQRTNAALALATVETLAKKIPIADEAKRIGLSGVQWPGRLQIVRSRPGQLIILDGAHNPAGAMVLRDSMRQLFPGTTVTLVFGVMQDKDWPSMCQILAPLTHQICLAPVGTDRTADPQVIQRYLRELAPNTEITASTSLADALSRTQSDNIVLIAGSLHFVGEAMEALHLSACPVQDERGLNEWVLSTR